jgi:LysM repeat protein
MVFDVVTAKDPVDMKILASALKVDFQELKELNISYKTQYAPVLDGEAFVRVPQGLGEAAKLAISDAVVKNKRFLAQAEVPRNKNSFLKYKVQRGETLDKIAERFDVSVEDILKFNRIRKSRIRPGTTLKIPSSAFNVIKETPQQASSKSKKSAPEKETVLHHVVKRGETLTRIAQQHKVSVATLARANNIGANNHVLYGQRLVIPR